MVNALLSIHDVMPANRPWVADMLQTLHRELPHLRPQQVTLLVVPGLGWQQDDLAWLRRLAGSGYVLAAHGWDHRAPASRSLFHHLHSAVLSRDAAEHLSRTRDELRQRLLWSRDWFARQALPPPALYVPPAWATGALTQADWSASGFSLVESLGSVFRTGDGQQRALPLLGFEADTPWRVVVLRLFNQWNWWRAAVSGQPLRIGLHPLDLSFGLGDDVLEALYRVARFIDYSSLWSSEETSVRPWSLDPG